MIRITITCLMQRASDHKRVTHEDVVAVERFSREMGLRINRLFELVIPSGYHEPYDERKAYRTMIVVSEYRESWVLSVVLVHGSEYVPVAMTDSEDPSRVIVSKAYKAFLGKRMDADQIRSLFRDFTGIIPLDAEATEKEVHILLHEERDAVSNEAVSINKKEKEEEICLNG